MDAEFWITAWNEGRTGFHQQTFNEKLLQYFPQLEPQEGQRVLVPLCGKTKDLLWLHQLKLKVHGIELYDDAVKSFFLENELAPVEKKTDQSFTHYHYGNITLSNGDFFKLSPDESYDLIYDRASLVALPASMRSNYAQIIKSSLKKGGKCLLILYEYDQSKMEGPPFSIDANEVKKLYEEDLTIELLESETPSLEGSRLASFDAGFKQNVYLLRK